MTPDQRREASTRIYRACFTIPSEATEPSISRESFGGIYFVSDGSFVKVYIRDSGWAKVLIVKSGSGLHVHGDLESVEATLDAIPNAMKVQP